MFIVIEGLDGSGKSTLIKNLSKALTEKGQTSFITKCPGGTSLGLKLRETLLSVNNLNWKTKILLFLADQVETLDKLITPALKDVNFVISDRFVYSTIAYANLNNDIHYSETLLLAQSIINPSLPDLVVHLDYDKETAIERLKISNHLDQESLYHFGAIKDSYTKVYKSLGIKPLVINTKVNSEEEVVQIVLRHLNL